jgi:hypothetical protein
MAPRRVSPAAVIGTLALVVAFTGTATAASGGHALLGKTNVSNKSTTIANRNGVALALVGKKSRPPLSVSRNATQVPSLNASLLGGVSAAGLRAGAKLFATPGQFTLVVPNGIHHAVFTAIGGGGGGGGGVGPGAGGGQGSYSQAWTPVTPGQSLFINVGAPGTGGAPSTPGGEGGASDVAFAQHDNADYLISFGGEGGGAGPACPTGVAATAGGLADGPSPAARTMGAEGITHIDGASGGFGIWIPLPKPGCPARTPVPGAGAGGRFAGAGGNGASGSGATGGGGSGSTGTGQDGLSGLVIVELLK